MQTRQRLLAAALAAAVGLGVAGTPRAWGEEAPKAGTAAEPAPAPPAPEQPFGWRLMTPEERAAHCAAMRAAATPEQREQLRAEHHAQMVPRARERGMALPDQPGMGPGAGCRGMPGMGMGMGPGAGMRGRGPMGGPPPAPPAPTP